MWHLYCLVLTNFQVLGDNFLAVAIHQNPNEFWWNSWGLVFCPFCGRNCTTHPMYLSQIKRLNVFNQYCWKETEEPHAKLQQSHPQCCHRSNDPTSTAEGGWLHVPRDNQKGRRAECEQGFRKKSKRMMIYKHRGLTVEWDVKDGGREGFIECSRKSIGSGTLSRSK